MILEDTEKLRLALRRRAMDLLARREHTRHELDTKLCAAMHKSQRRLDSPLTPQAQILISGLVSEVLDKLEQDQLLSDSRFTESYVNGRLNRGYGPLYIRHQLRQKQVDGALLDNNLQQFDQEQWLEQLSSLINRRLSDTAFPEPGSKEYLKLQRFALSRGFTGSQWSQLVKRFRSP